MKKLPKGLLFFVPVVFFVIYTSVLLPVIVFRSPNELRPNFLRSVLLNAPCVAVPLLIAAIVSALIYPNMITRKIKTSTFVWLILVINALLLIFTAIFASLVATIIERPAEASMDKSFGYLFGMRTALISYLLVIVFFIKEAQDYSK